MLILKYDNMWFPILLIIISESCASQGDRDRISEHSDRNRPTIENGEHEYSYDTLRIESGRLDVLKKINELENFRDFFKLVNGLPSEYAVYASNLEVEERSNALFPKPAKCKPILTAVSVVQPSKQYIYFPACVLVQKCSGCCNTEFLSCEATVTAERNYMIVAVDYAANYQNTTIVPFIEDVECKCVCKKDMLCACDYADKREKCIVSTRHNWSSETCECQCIKKEECDKSKKWDPNLCSCTEVQKRDPYNEERQYGNDPQPHALSERPTYRSSIFRKQKTDPVHHLL